MNSRKPPPRWLTLALGVLVVLGAAQPALAEMQIMRIRFNPPGKDDGSNENLNKELIVIENTGPLPEELAEWTINDRNKENVFEFPSITVDPGEIVRLRSGDGADAAVEGGYELFWNLEDYVWDNDADRAKLKDPSGTEVDSCSYRKTKSPAVCGAA